VLDDDRSIGQQFAIATAGTGDRVEVGGGIREYVSTAPGVDGYGADECAAVRAVRR